MFKKLHKFLKPHERAEILSEALQAVAEPRKPTVFFSCDLKQIQDFNSDTGAYSLEELKQFSKNTETIIIIKNYGVIEGGELCLQS